MPQAFADWPAELVQRLAEAPSLGIVTGAGLSVASGIRAYRGVGGVYTDPEEGAATLQDLQGHTLLRTPERTWARLAQLGQAAASAAPNDGHHAIVALGERLPDVRLLTQNVDGLHRAAGGPPAIEIHGRLDLARCQRCGAERDLPLAELVAIQSVPRCTACGGRERPGVVLFGEALPDRALQAMEAAFFTAPPAVSLSVGTSSQFPYIAGAGLAGSLRIQVDPHHAELGDDLTHWIQMPAEEALPRLVEALPSL